MVYFDTAGYRIVLLTSTSITRCDKVRERLTAIRGHAGRHDDEEDELRLPAAALLSTSQADILQRKEKVSALLYSLHKATCELTLEDFFVCCCVLRSAHFGTL